MRISRQALVLSIALVAGCTAGDSLIPRNEATPEPLTVTPVDMHTIQLRWTRVDGARTYEIARRANFVGDFEAIATGLSRTQLSLVDRDLEPNTVYGYRLTAFDDFGQALGTSTVGSGRTAPEPGIEVVTQSTLGGDPAQSIDSSGYRVVVRGNGVDQALPVEVSGRQRFEPLPAGIYSVKIEDVASQCELAGTATRVITVTDQGLQTIATAAFDLSCRDRTRGRIKAKVTATGDTTDANGFKVVLSGVASDPSLPPAERAVVITRDLGSAGGDAVFDNLRPGTYSVLLDDVSPACAVDGDRQRDSLRVTPLGDLQETLAVTCSSQGGGGGGNKPFIYQNAWSRDTAAVGAKVTVAATLDLRAESAAEVGGFQFVLQTPTAVVRLDSVIGASGWGLVSNTSVPGRLQVNAVRSTGAKGLVPLLLAHYTVIGADGDKAPTVTSSLLVAGPDGSSLDAKVRRVEDTLVVGAGGGGPGPVNQPPVAVANGPYTGTAGQPVTLTAAGSTDPDGTIASYAWTFGDTQTGTGQAPSHTWQNAGTYTATLTVTDDKGATASATATVTIAPAGPPPSQPFTWKAEFGAINPADQTIPLTISLDLSTDIPETTGPEALQDWVVDSLKWNPNVLQYFSFQFGSGTGTVNFIEALTRGVLRFRGTVAPAKSTGIVPIATIRFKISGNNGDTTTARQYLGSIVGSSATGNFGYKSRIKVEDPKYTVGGSTNPTTTVSGTVTSPQQGPLSGVTVAIGSITAVTGGSGAYTLGGIAPGSYSVTVSNVPAGCTPPAAKSVTVATTPVTGVDFTVVCPAPSGVTVSGTVTSPQQGPLAGVTVSLGAGLTGITSAAGTFTIINVAAGSYNAALSNLPSGCTAPAPQPVTVASSNVTNVNFTVTCPAPAPMGTVSGSIGFASGSSTPSLATVVVTITPAGGSAITTNPNAAGAWTKSGIPVGTGAGVVAISALPTGCTATTSTANYTGLAAGTTVTVPAFQVNCPAAPANKYELSVTWGAITGGKATMSAKIDMTKINDPANNGSGADVIGAFQGVFGYPTARLTNPVCTQTQMTGVVNTTNAGQINAVLTNLSGLTGNAVAIISCTFDVTGTGPTLLTLTGLLLGDNTGAVEFSGKTNVTIAPLP